MIVTLVGKERISSVMLPYKIKGQYWLYAYENGKRKKAVSIEEDENTWRLRTRAPFRLINKEGMEEKNSVLVPLKIYSLKREQNQSCFIFTEPLSPDRQVFTKYLVEDGTEFIIGRREENDIVFQNPHVSVHHAVLTYFDGVWEIRDLQSVNGTFVNEMRVQSTVLKPGDQIFIMGFKMIVGKNFLAMNNPNGSVRHNEKKIFSFIKQPIEKEDEEERYELKPTVYFSQIPRFKQDIQTAEFKVDAPPAPQNVKGMPLGLRIGGTALMGVVSLASMASPLVALPMLAGTCAFPIATVLYDRNKKAKTEQLRQTKYRAYLRQIALGFQGECSRQETILRENFPPVDQCVKRIADGATNLWDRRMEHNDFLVLRAGHGGGMLDAKISYSERKFTLEEDNLQEELLALCESPKYLYNIPITVSLQKNYILGIRGNRGLLINMAKNFMFQIAAYYSFDIVKMIFLYDEEEAWLWDFVKWLPHVWIEEKTFRFVATNRREVQEISADLENEIAYRLSKKQELEGSRPHYVIFPLSRTLFEAADFIRSILEADRSIHFSIVNFGETLQALPKECMMIVELSSLEEGKIFEKNGAAENVVTFIPDVFQEDSPVALSKQLANIFLEAEKKEYEIPKMLTFLEMYKVGKIEQLNPLNRWKENSSVRTLAAPVGVDGTGRLVQLDLHENAHGPHGLIAGMTGSGKSEFIITYILSMAVNYHPDEVAFILIDYKGGGLAGAFVDEERGVKLPHIAGTITNLDGASITRSLISIQSELKRRQEIFNEAKRISNEGTMDIYTYQKLHRQGMLKEPLPHLFIVSDEFAELKTQQPEFMEQLISAARIGRSLGVHLILATQKSNGVVDDQIWSNSRFRVCLKVQEKVDSMDMIKRPDAAALVETGRFYLQVGFNELFEMGQSAWCGAPYVLTEGTIENYDSSVSIIDNLGRPAAEARPKDGQATGLEEKQLVALVKYLSNIAKKEQIEVRPLWLEPIPERIFVNALETKYGYQAEKFFLNPIIGELDDPSSQSQRLMTLPISKEGHAICYGSAGSGTENMVATLTYSLIRHHTPKEVNLYILDFGAETLKVFEKAPQVGEVLFSSEDEKITNLFKMLKEETAQRKKLCAEYGGSFGDYIRQSEKKMPNFVVLINNFAVFSEIFEQQEEVLTSLSRECQKYGIYFILTALSNNAVRYRLQQNFKQLLVLQMNDPSDYTGILGQTEGICPSKLMGRGIVKYDRVYEFQTALASEEENLIAFYRKYAKEAGEQAEIFAKKVPILPKFVDMDFLEGSLTNKKRLPIGVNRHNLQMCYVNLTEHYMLPVFGEDLEETRIFAESLAEVLASLGEVVMVLDGDSSFSFEEERCVLVKERLEKTVVRIFSDMVARNNTYKDAGMAMDALDSFQERTYFLFGAKNIFEQLSEDGRDKLHVLLEKGRLEYKMHFILFESAADVSAYSFQSWYKQHIPGNEGIWVGSGIAEQYTLKLNRMSSSLSADLGKDFGYVVIKGRETLVKLLNTRKQEMEVYGYE